MDHLERAGATCGNRPIRDWRIRAEHFKARITPLEAFGADRSTYENALQNKYRLESTWHSSHICKGNWGFAFFFP
jgi:hypothetical protein